MKKMFSLLIAMTVSGVLCVGCNTGPGESTDEEAQRGMDETMAIDTMGDTMGDSTGDATGDSTGAATGDSTAAATGDSTDAATDTAPTEE